MNSWLQLQTQRLREQGFRKRTHAAIKKILANLISPLIDQLQARSHLRKAALYMLRVTGLTARVKALLSAEPTPQVSHLSPRALEIRQELQIILDRLEKTS
jgi:hypothetical protein